VGSIVRVTTMTPTSTTNKGSERMKGKTLMNFIVDGRFKDDVFVNITIVNVPGSLLKEFMRTVVNPSYPGGISEALQDLMRKETERRKRVV
jgi:uncharacterized membrane protein